MRTEENKKPNNPPAFPTMEHGSDRTGCPTVLTYEGMTLRDYFAGLSMQSIVINVNNNVKEGLTDSHYSHPDFIAEEAYSVADAMLKQRENV